MNSQQKKPPLVSVVIPTYNEEDNIARCLESVVCQSYPKDKLEIIVVDGMSEDRTVEIAQNIGARIIENPKRGAQIGKALGIRNSKGDFLALLEADIEIVHKDWLEKTIAALFDDESTIGADAKFLVRKEDPAINRYCALVRLEDPIVRRFGFLRANSEIVNRRGYKLLKVRPCRYPVFGAGGFVWRRMVLEPYIGGMVSFDEADITARMLEDGLNKVAYVPSVGVYHHHVKSLKDFFKKRIRNGVEFMARRERCSRRSQTIWVERYSKWELFVSFVFCLTVVGPLLESFGGFIKRRDSAWFLNPFICFVTAWIYLLVCLDFYTGRNVWKGKYGILNAQYG